MENFTERIKSNSESLKKPYPSSAVIALICSCMAALIMAFLIIFGISQSCSQANIAIFMVLLGISSILALSGIITGAISYRKTKNRLALASLLFIFLYIALLIFLIQLIY